MIYSTGFLALAILYERHSVNAYIHLCLYKLFGTVVECPYRVSRLLYTQQISLTEMVTSVISL